MYRHTIQVFDWIISFVLFEFFVSIFILITKTTRCTSIQFITNQRFYDLFQFFNVENSNQSHTIHLILSSCHLWLKLYFTTQIENIHERNPNDGIFMIEISLTFIKMHCIHTAVYKTMSNVIMCDMQCTVKMKIVVSIDIFYIYLCI